MSEPFKKTKQSFAKRKKDRGTKKWRTDRMLLRLSTHRYYTYRGLSSEQSTKSLFITYLNCLLSKQYYVVVAYCMFVLPILSMQKNIVHVLIYQYQTTYCNYEYHLTLDGHCMILAASLCLDWWLDEDQRRFVSVIQSISNNNFLEAAAVAAQ